MPSCGVCLFVCPSVRLSVTFVDHVKTNKHFFEIFSPSGSQAILVFFTPNGMAIFRREPPPNGGVDCRWGRQKTRCWTNIWLRCIQVYSIVNRTSREVWQIKPRRTAASVEPSPRRSSSVVRTRWRLSVCDGLDVRCRRRREVKPPPWTQLPFGHNPVFCCRRTSWDRTRRVFLLKTDTSPYSWP